MENCSIYTQKLKQYLERMDGKDLEKDIIKETCLKHACIFCVLNDVSAQTYGTLLQNYIIKKYNYTKLNSSECLGDCSKNGKNFEIKVSLGGKKHDKFNFVQIRISHDIHYYILVAYHISNENVNNDGELYVFKIDKNDIKHIILKYGQYAHGSKKTFGQITMDDLNDKNNIKEYCLRPVFNSSCWKELLKYKVDEKELLN